MNPWQTFHCFQIPQVKEILIEESNVQLVNIPVTVCADIHGQFHDLYETFLDWGSCAWHFFSINFDDLISVLESYIFLNAWQGDFVDLGYNSLEVFTILLLLKASDVLLLHACICLDSWLLVVFTCIVNKIITWNLS